MECRRRPVRLGTLIAAASLTTGLCAGLWLYLSLPPAAKPISVARPLPVEEAKELDHTRALFALAIAASRCRGASCGGDAVFGGMLAEEARWQLDHPDLRYRDDCSGYVSAVASGVGVDMDGVVASIYELAVVHDALHWDEVPRVGDLVFFDDTHDRDRDGLWDDELTHIGIVLEVDEDGTATFGQAGLGMGRGLGTINLKYPSDREFNSLLRSWERGDAADSRHLTGELWTAWATLDPSVDWLTDPPPPDSWP